MRVDKDGDYNGYFHQQFAVAYVQFRSQDQVLHKVELLVCWRVAKQHVLSNDFRKTKA